METMLQLLTQKVSKVFHGLGYQGIKGKVSKSDRADLCQFQCNDSFIAAKIYKKSPLAIAEEVAIVLKADQPAFKEVEVATPGFINLTLTDEYLLKSIFAIYNYKDLAVAKIEKPECLILDYGGPNIAKPLHIGHLRSAIIGESLKRLFRTTGYKVIGDSHLGDWGLQMGLVIAEYQERNPDLACFRENFDPNKDPLPDVDVSVLNEIYPFANAKSKIDKEFMQKAKQITFSLQKGKVGYRALWSQIRKTSIDNLKKIYAELSVDFDLWNGESDSEEYIAPLFKTLEDQHLLYESKGALVVDVATEDDKKPIPPVLIQKSDAAILYATTDLATIMERKEKYNPDKIWYVVDARQELHFEHIFRCARKAKLIEESVDLYFLGFGTINGSDGKPYKTRDGGVMRLEIFIEMVKEKAYKQLNNSEYVKSLSIAEKRELAKRIGMAAIKFGDLVNHCSKNYIFDMDRFLSFEGKTGPYLLYTLSRIHSLLKKVQALDKKVVLPKQVGSEEERQLILTLLQNGDIFSQAIKEKAPHIICEQVYRVASAFSRFYQSCNIINEENQERKNDLICLTIIVRKFLLFYLNILGIEPVEQM